MSTPRSGEGTPPRVDRSAPARRLAEVRGLLDSDEGASSTDIAERFAVNVRTAIRYIRVLTYNKQKIEHFETLLLEHPQTKLVTGILHQRRRR